MIKEEDFTRVMRSRTIVATASQMDWDEGHVGEYATRKHNKGLICVSLFTQLSDKRVRMCLREVLDEDLAVI
jgi:hypothetical protein